MQPNRGSAGKAPLRFGRGGFKRGVVGLHCTPATALMLHRPHDFARLPVVGVTVTSSRHSAVAAARRWRTPPHRRHALARAALRAWNPGIRLPASARSARKWEHPAAAAASGPGLRHVAQPAGPTKSFSLSAPRASTGLGACAMGRAAKCLRRRWNGVCSLVLHGADRAPAAAAAHGTRPRAAEVSGGASHAQPAAPEVQPPRMPSTCFSTPWPRQIRPC